MIARVPIRRPVVCAPCVERAPFFDDAASYGHAALGFVCALPGVGPGAAAAITSAYIFYQMRETERLSSKVGDFCEFALGWLVGRMAL